MKSLLFFFPFFIFVLPTTSLFVLLPLYIYPLDSSASAWKPFFDAFTKYPSVHWQAVINIDSGPGGPAALTSDGYPTDSYYINAISKLNSYPNVQTLGYVHSNYTVEPYSKLIHNISVYAKWASYKPNNITIDGIFFDETSSSSAPSVLTYMHNASSYAYETIPTDITPVVFNVGVKAPSQYFQWADTIIQFENGSSTYLNYTTINSIPKSNRNQTAILVHDVPPNAPIKSWVHTLIYYGIEAAYFTLDCCYNSVDTTFLNSFVSAIVAG